MHASVYARPHVKEKPAFFKDLHSGSHFENLNLVSRNFPKKLGGAGKALGTSL